MPKSNYDSQFCGSLPIHFINQVQSYGFLFVCDTDLTIIQVSENSEVFTDICFRDFIGQKLEHFVTGDSYAEFMQKLSGKEDGRVTATLVFNNLRKFLAVIHLKADHCLLEFENYVQQDNSFSKVYQQIREASSAIEYGSGLQASLEVAARELKEFSGFDKVMIYKFDEYWNGYVIAEEMEEGMESYLGITFPASDIPKQARDLYLKNPFRRIPDREYVPSKLYPVINQLKNGFVDLSDCNLRGVAKVHVEYLGNMQVKASMSTRILKENKLWGLIACHHREKKFLTYDQCSVFELLSNIISLKISSADTKESFEQTTQMQGRLSRIVEDLYSVNNLQNALDKTAVSIMELLNFSGLAHIKDSKLKCFGECPSFISIHELVIWLQSKGFTTPFASSHLSDEYEDANRIADVASGLMVFPLVPDTGEYILGFRREILKTINWGGNPNEAIQFDKDIKTYHPRHSFQVWKEDIRNNSAPFRPSEMQFSKELQRIFIEKRLSELNRV